MINRAIMTRGIDPESSPLDQSTVAHLDIEGRNSTDHINTQAHVQIPIPFCQARP